MTERFDKLALRNTIEALEQLSEGIDPTSGLLFDEDTILNQINNQRTLKSAVKFLRLFYHSYNLHLKKIKSIPFYIDESEIELLKPLQYSSSVSQLTYYINSIISRPEMKNLKATQITQWLTDQGYLEIVQNEEGDNHKAPTEKGFKIGIFSEERFTREGKRYLINLYNESAQSLVIDNLIEITQVC